MSNFKKSIAFSIIDVLEELLKPVTWPYHGNPTIVRNQVIKTECCSVFLHFVLSNFSIAKSVAHLFSLFQEKGIGFSLIGFTLQFTTCLCSKHYVAKFLMALHMKLNYLTLATVGFWCQTIHKKFLRRFDTIFGLKMMMKSGLEKFILKFHHSLQSCCCPVQKNLHRKAELAWQVSRYL